MPTIRTHFEDDQRSGRPRCAEASGKASASPKVQSNKNLVDVIPVFRNVPYFSTKILILKHPPARDTLSPVDEDLATTIIVSEGNGLPSNAKRTPGSWFRPGQTAHLGVCGIAIGADPSKRDDIDEREPRSDADGLGWHARQPTTTTMPSKPFYHRP